MPYSIIDTNVPLIAAGHSNNLTDSCRSECVAYIESVLAGKRALVIDQADEVLMEYGRNIDTRNRSSDLDCLFLIHLYNHQFNSNYVHRLELLKREDGQFEDYPDPDDNWTSSIRRCERFDQDDKKWVALAVAYSRETGADAPIVNAADRCWLAFEPLLVSAGVKLQSLCQQERR